MWPSLWPSDQTQIRLCRWGPTSSEMADVFQCCEFPTQCGLEILNLDTEITTKGITQKKKTKIGNMILQLYKLLSNLYLVDFQGAKYPPLRILLRIGQNLLDHEWLRKTNAPALEDLAVKHPMFCYLDWITKCCKSWRRIQTQLASVCYKNCSLANQNTNCPVLLSSICSGDLNFSISISWLILQLRNELCLVIVYGRIAWRPQRASVTIVEEDWCLLTEFDLNHLADKSESPNSQRLLTKSAASSKFTMESSFLWDTWT